MKEILKKYLPVLFMVTMGIIIYVNHNEEVKITKYLEKNGKLCKGEVTEVGNKEIKFEYLIDNIVYSKKRSKPYSGLQCSEKFEVLFDKNNYEKSNIQFSRPIIEDSIYTILKPTHIRKIRLTWNNEIEFSYAYNNIKYKKVQQLSEEQWNREIEFIVKVNTKNPKIAYLFPH